MPNRTVLDDLRDLTGVSCRFAPINDLPKPKGNPHWSMKEFFILSKYIPLSEASVETFQQQPTAPINRAVKEARYFVLIDLARDLGIIQCDDSIGIKGALMLLQADGEGVVAYSEDLSFSFYLDYDIAGHVIEIDFPKEILVN
jgi:hypothetical protein